MFSPDLTARHAIDPLPVLLLAGCLICGCDGNSGIREYEIEKESERVLTSDVLRDQFPTIPFDWNTPESWKEAENDRFSKFAWTAGPGDAPARITVSDLPDSAGIEQQFLRWQGQLQLSESNTPELLKSVEKIPLGNTTGHWVEIRGETETILGIIVPHQDKLWVFKYRSPNSTAETERADFRSFCDSMKAV